MHMSLPAKGLPANPENLWLEIPGFNDARGGLSFVEAEKDVPFAFRRAYYLYGVKAPRGAHAHHNLHQLFIAMHGSFTLHLDDGHHKHSLKLDNPARGIIVGPMVWRDLDDFSEDAVCLVLASEHYDEADYIRDYNDFLKLTKE
jgi:hypothetical protein